MKQLIIDRSKWRTGGESDNTTGIGHTALLNEEGYMCCLGFFCLAAGLSERDIIDAATPNDAYFNNDIDLIPVARFEEEEYADTMFAEIAININDDTKIDSDTREIKIKEHFASVGIEIKFINEYN